MKKTKFDEKTFRPKTWNEQNEYVRRTYPKIKFRDNILNGHRQHINQLGPYHIFLTLVFSVPVNDTLAENSISHLFKIVQRKLYPREAINNNKCFTGVSVGERHIKSISRENSLHFHSLIKIDSSLWSHKSLDEIKDAFITKAKSLVNYNLNYRYQIANNDDAIDFQAPYSIGVETYSIKDLMKVWTGFDTRIGYISSTGIPEFSTVIERQYF